MKRAVAFLFALLFSFSLFSCSQEPESENTAVIISKQTLSFAQIGESYELDFYVIKNGRLAPELSEQIVWTTTNPDIATCEGGVVTSTGYGSCVIRAAYEDFYSLCVVQTPNPNASLIISNADVTLDNIGASQRIVALSESGDEISSSVEWISSNENIAVCNGGFVVATGYGSCTIMARNRTETAVCTVTVNNPTAPIVTLSEKSLDLQVGATHTLAVTTGNNAGAIVSWKSTDESVATCQDGVITGISDGVCVVLAISENGYSGYSIVTVGTPQKNADHAQYLDFGFKNLGRELKYVDKTTGSVDSSLLVYDYVMETRLLDDGRLVVEITLSCVKTYDREGTDALSTAAITASIYRENDAFCERRQYRAANVALGETCTIKCSGFTVQTSDGSVREFYMTFSPITEHQSISW